MKRKDIYEHTDVEDCTKYTGKNPTRVRWVHTNTAEGEEPGAGDTGSQLSCSGGWGDLAGGITCHRSHLQHKLAESFMEVDLSAVVKGIYDGHCS